MICSETTDLRFC